MALKGKFKSFLVFLVVLGIIGSCIGTFSGPRIKENTAFIKMDLYFAGAAKNKEWAESIWKAAQNPKVTKIVIEAKAEYVDSYGKSETRKKDIDITSLVSPLSEIRKYTQSHFSDEFGDYIVAWVSDKMSR